MPPKSKKGDALEEGQAQPLQAVVSPGVPPAG